MKRIFPAILLATLVVVLAACGGSPKSSSSDSGSNSNAQAIPNIAGPWEFTLDSSGGTQTAIDVALQEGKSLVNGAMQPDGALSASDTQMTFVTFDTSNGLVTSFSGNCGSGGNNNVSGSITSLGTPLTNFTFTENGNVFDVSASISGDGSTITGTYQSVAGSACPDSGNFNGRVLTKLPSATYVGTLILPTCASGVSGCNSVTATFSESSSGTANLTLLLNGLDTLTLTGPVTGNVFVVQGSYQGSTLVLYGYDETPNLLLANSATPTQAAGLLKPQN